MTIKKFGHRTRGRSERFAVFGLELDDEDLKAVYGRLYPVVSLLKINVMAVGRGASRNVQSFPQATRRS